MLAENDGPHAQGSPLLVLALSRQPAGSSSARCVVDCRPPLDCAVVGPNESETQAVG